MTFTRVSPFLHRRPSRHCESRRARRCEGASSLFTRPGIRPTEQLSPRAPWTSKASSTAKRITGCCRMQSFLSIVVSSAKNGRSAGGLCARSNPRACRDFGQVSLSTRGGLASHARFRNLDARDTNESRFVPCQGRDIGRARSVDTMWSNAPCRTGTGVRGVIRRAPARLGSRCRLVDERCGCRVVNVLPAGSDEQCATAPFARARGRARHEHGCCRCRGSCGWCIGLLGPRRCFLKLSRQTRLIPRLGRLHRSPRIEVMDFQSGVSCSVTAPPDALSPVPLFGRFDCHQPSPDGGWNGLILCQGARLFRRG